MDADDIDEVLQAYRYPQSITDLGNFYFYFGPLSVFINISTFILIYTKTPLAMKTIRDTLLVLQVILTFMDIVMFVCRPFAFIPHILIIVYGFFDSPTSINLQVVLIIILLYVSISTSHILLYQRFRTLLKANTFFKLISTDVRYIIALNIVFSVTAVPLFFIFITSNQEDSRQYFLENHPWSHEIITNRAVCVVQIKSLYHTLILFIAFLGIFEHFVALIIAVICMKLVNEVSSNTASKQARLIQKRFTHVLIAQVVIPTLAILLPACLATTSILLTLRTKWNGILIELGIISISFYATTSSLCKVVCCCNYRMVLWNVCCKTKVYSV
ncbi:unnamed protein product [Auanema sp. JU1783]|nr:unnamed protein product [Auanema sp. JU1783]